MPWLLLQPSSEVALAVLGKHTPERKAALLTGQHSVQRNLPTTSATAMSSTTTHRIQPAEKFQFARARLRHIADTDDDYFFIDVPIALWQATFRLLDAISSELITPNTTRIPLDLKPLFVAVSKRGWVKPPKDVDDRAYANAASIVTEAVLTAHRRLLRRNLNARASRFTLNGRVSRPRRLDGCIEFRCAYMLTHDNG